MRADALLGQALDIPTLVRRTFSNLVQRMSPHLAQSGHPDRAWASQDFAAQIDRRTPFRRPQIPAVITR